MQNKNQSQDQVLCETSTNKSTILNAAQKILQDENSY
jgi:hypothetical protein